MSATPAGDAVDRLRALQRWWQPPDATRREVRRSRAGQHHPDQDVAWVAWRWADADQ